VQLISASIGRGGFDQRGGCGAADVVRRMWCGGCGAADVVRRRVARHLWPPALINYTSRSDALAKITAIRP